MCVARIAYQSMQLCLIEFSFHMYDLVINGIKRKEVWQITINSYQTSCLCM